MISLRRSLITAHASHGQPIPIDRLRSLFLYAAAEMVSDSDGLVSERSRRCRDARPSVMPRCMSALFGRYLGSEAAGASFEGSAGGTPGLAVAAAGVVVGIGGSSAGPAAVAGAEAEVAVAFDGSPPAAGAVTLLGTVAVLASPFAVEAPFFLPYRLPFAAKFGASPCTRSLDRTRDALPYVKTEPSEPGDPLPVVAPGRPDRGEVRQRRRPIR